MKHLFILNPAAGKRDQTADFRAKIQAACDPRGLDYEIYISRAKGDCTAKARAEAQKGEELRIYACGGDGTLNEIVAGVVDCPNAAITHFCGGSGNDFVKIFDEPGAFRDLERLLDEPQETRFDLISWNGHYAINICSLGLDARIGAGVADLKRRPLLSGSGAYLVSAIREIFRGIHRHYVVEVNGERLDQEATLICMAGGRWYGGGFYAVPEADPTDGLLDVLYVKKVSRLTALSVILAYRKGQWKNYPQYIRHIHTRRLVISCEEPEPLNLDGEMLSCREVEISTGEKQVRFFYPRGLSWQAKIPEVEPVKLKVESSC